MPASRMCHGVSKSGSPMPSEMTSFIFETISKKSRMPDLGRSTTWRAIKRLVSMVAGGRRKISAGIFRCPDFPVTAFVLRGDVQPAVFLHRHVDEETAFLVGAQ